MKKTSKTNVKHQTLLLSSITSYAPSFILATFLRNALFYLQHGNWKREITAYQAIIEPSCA